MAEKNPLNEEVKKDLPVNLYSEKDKDYLSFLQGRLERAKNIRNQPHPEFNDKTYIQYYENNEKIANTKLEPKKNDDDVIVSAGTIENKLDALLSNINNLNLESEVHSFDRENNRIAALGTSLEDIIHDTKIRDGADGGGDEEKKMMRQRELAKQGTVFIQEEWLKKFETKKKLKKEYNGEFKDFDGWETKLVKVFEGPSRSILYSPNVYLGDITEFYMENQPFVCVVIQKDYEEAKKVYGKFENWKYVRKGEIKDSSEKTIYDNKWQLTELKDNQVEIIMYQDQSNDEFQIIINGVLMLPIGFPLSAVSPMGKYNIAKQVLRILNSKFTYGGSFVSSGSVKEISALIDEMLKLFVLKTRKSVTPAYVNTSGRVINKKVLSPGRISMGISPDDLVPIAGNETQGTTAGELGIYKELQELLNKSTVSEQFAGQQGKSGTTATEVITLQKQARLTLGLIIAACMLLEKKIDYLRLWNIIENWFKPVGNKIIEINNVRKLIKNFRKVNREVNIENEGRGERSIIPIDGKIPSSDEIRQMELEEESAKGFPVRKIFISPKDLRRAKLFWYIIVTTKEKETSSFYKLIFREQLNDMITLMQLGSVPNREALEDEFSRVWKTSKNKLFQKKTIAPDISGASSAMGGNPVNEPLGRPANQSGVPKVTANISE